ASRGNLGAWLAVIARNRAIDARRKRKPESDIEDVVLSVTPDMVSDADRSRVAEKVRGVLGTMSAPQRSALEMAYYEGLTHTEIAKEPRVPGTASGRASRFNWWAALGWTAAVAMLIVVVQLRRENYFLRESVTNLGALTSQQTLELANAQRVVDTLTAPEAQTVTLAASKNPQPQGKAFYLKNRSGLVFVANNLPALPADKIYELWLIPPTGAPIAAGLFKPDAKGNATIVN